MNNEHGACVLHLQFANAHVIYVILLFLNCFYFFAFLRKLQSLRLTIESSSSVVEFLLKFIFEIVVLDMRMPFLHR